jgi:TonB family protein
MGIHEDKRNMSARTGFGNDRAGIHARLRGLRAGCAQKGHQDGGLSAVTAKVSPEYPPIARQLKIEGAVELEAVVSENGTVEKVNIVSGNPVLTRPAVDAVKKWKYAPFTSEGKTVKAAVPVTLSFKL